MNNILVWRLAFLVAMLAPALTQEATADDKTPAVGSETEGPYTFNLRNSDLQIFAEQVAKITGRTLVIDPDVSGSVTVLSSAPLNKVGVWDLFQSVLGINGMMAVRSGDLWRIVTLDSVRGSGAVATAAVSENGRLDLITRLLELDTFPADTAVEALRPLVTEFGYLEAVPGTNTLIVTDTAENVERVQSIARDLDMGGQSQVFTIRVKQANAIEIGAALQTVLDAENGPRITVDARANSIVVRGSAETRRVVESIVSELDVPAQRESANTPIIQMYRLQNVDAVSIAKTLQGVFGLASSEANNPVVDALALETTPTDVDTNGIAASVIPGNGTSQPSVGVSIQPVVSTNGILVRGTPDVQKEIAALISSLDLRRPQVLIEAAIVEVSGEIAEQLGVQLGIGSAVPPGGFAATSYSASGPTLSSILTLLGVPESAAVAKAGLSIGAADDQFGILIQALGQSSKARLLSTPSITTIDNQPAEIIVGQNVPFRTGSFSSTEAGDSAFTTIERRDVGITMKVVPRVNDGNVVQLEVKQEVSALTDTAVEGAADLVTNRRSISTTVLADDGGTIVLGGLITNDSQTAGSQVPGISRVPLIGELFKSRTERRKKQTLFVFLRPTILRNRIQSSTVAEDRYQRLKSIEVDPLPSSPLSDGRSVKRLPVEINGIY